nr:RNA-directed DNA polymerase, eukaryota [Tanacetum cinerariifolium]
MDVKFMWGNSSYSFVYSEANGYSGGIICVWESTVFKKENATISDNFVAVYGTWLPTNSKILFVAVYAPQRLTCKRRLWDYVSTLIDRWNGEVVVLGDFNEVRVKEERRGSCFNPTSARAFDQFITSSGLVDVKMEGYEFTWIHPSGSKMSKLDRFLVFEGIYSVFPSITAMCLDKHLSDHRPIVLCEVQADFGPVPFRFYHSWFSLEGFDDMVEQTWGSSLHCDSNKMIRFNDKDLITNELADIDKLVDCGIWSDSIHLRRSELQRNLFNINQMKSKELFQKSKVKWAIEGDENSKFFHGLINKKRSQLAIRGVFIEGVWCTNPSTIKEVFYNHFEARFKQTGNHRLLINFPFKKRLSATQVDDLERCVSRDEIKSAVWSCGTDKSPGPDGFSFEFFRKYWSFVGHDLCEAVEQFFSTGSFPNGCNSSFIALIPKDDEVEVESKHDYGRPQDSREVFSDGNVSDDEVVLDTVFGDNSPIPPNHSAETGKPQSEDPFRIYDILNKQPRAEPHEKKIQDLKIKISSWVRDKKSCINSDKDLITNELADIDKLVNCEGVWCTNPSTFKEVFYNHFEARFKQTGNHRLLINFPFKKRLSATQADDLERCVSRDEIKSAVWSCGTDKSPRPDGFSFEFFRKYWSFVGHDLCEAVEQFFSTGSFPNGCNSSFIALIPKVTDAKFVNDFRPISLIGSLYKVVTKDYLIDVLEAFGFGNTWCKWIRGTFSSAKASVLVNGSPTNEFPFYCGLKQGDPLSPYLFILIVESLNLSFSRAIDEGVFKGIQLHRSFFISHLFYADDAMFIGEWSDNNLKGVMVGDCMSRSHAWDSMVNKLSYCLSNWKIIWAAWPKVLASKKNGGLGVSSFYALNRALLLKWIWRFTSQDGSLWYRVIKALYGPSIESHPIKLSSNWCAIIRESHVLAEKGFNFLAHCKKRIGQQLVDITSLLSSVSLLLACERWVCDISGDEEFRVKEVRSLIDNLFLPRFPKATRWVRYVPIKINVFAWRARRDFLPTGIALDSPVCPLCLSSEEDGNHVFFGCGLAANIFRRLCRWWDLEWQDLSSFSEWYSWFSSVRLSSKVKDLLEGVCYIAWWSVWGFRNRTIFNDSPPRR